MKRKFEIGYCKDLDMTILEEVCYKDNGDVASTEIVSFLFGDGYTVDDMVKAYHLAKWDNRNPLKAVFEFEE